jgi:Beta/Gamma crystallin
VYPASGSSTAWANQRPLNPGILPAFANYHGAHKHVFLAEANLNAPDDNYFNDKVSSFHILSGLWVFFRDSQFQNPYANGTEFGPAIDGSWVEAVGIKNDDMSSLRGSVQ